MKKSLPIISSAPGGGSVEPVRDLDGYAPSRSQSHRVHVRRRSICLGKRLMQMAIARYADHVDVR
jgi:hypothetical protein